MTIFVQISLCQKVGAITTSLLASLINFHLIMDYRLIWKEKSSPSDALLFSMNTKILNKHSPDITKCQFSLYSNTYTARNQGHPDTSPIQLLSCCWNQNIFIKLYISWREQWRNLDFNFYQEEGKKPMICKKKKKIKSSKKNIHNQKLREWKSAHHRSREGLMGQSK